MTTKYIAHGIGDLSGKGKMMVSVKANEKGLETIDGQWYDYTPTVTLVGGSGNTVPVYTTNEGRYCRHCDIIYVDVLLEGDGGAEGAGTGRINIALPIQASSSKVNDDSVVIMGNIQNGSTVYVVGGVISQDATTVQLGYFKKAEEAINVTGALQNNTTRRIRLHFWYEVD